MKWYSANCLFECEVKGETRPRKHSLEERIFLLKARAERFAMQKAKRLGRSMETSYLNPYGKQVRWRLRKVLEVQEILEDELAEGVEVYSKVIRTPSGLTSEGWRRRRRVPLS